MGKVVILLSLVLLSSLIVPVFAQSSSQSNLCPQGTTPEAKGMDVICVPNSDVKRTCPRGTYQGLDNQGNFACRDIETNNIVNPQTGITTDSQTGQIILDDDQTMAIGVGIVLFIIIIAVIASASKKRPQTGSTDYSNVKRRPFSPETKDRVKERQGGRCNKCGVMPTHWAFDHIRGRGDNSISNCQGLCLDCHQDKTLKDNW